MTDDTKLSADKVAAFLRQNPEFFQQRSDLLELMRLPDPRGPAVSLLERQAAILRERNQELRERLNGLIDVARENDQLFEHTRRLTLALLEARSTDKLLRQRLLRTGKAVCGVLRGEELQALFQDQAEQVRSAAVVPLEHNGRLGILAIGSRDAMHFRSSMGTLFITHIGQVLSRRLVDVSRPASPRQAQRA